MDPGKCKWWPAKKVVVVLFLVVGIGFNVVVPAENTSSVTVGEDVGTNLDGRNLDLSSHEANSTFLSVNVNSNDKERGLGQSPVDAERPENFKESDEKHPVENEYRLPTTADDYYDEYEASFIRRHYGEVLAAASSWDDSLDDILDLRNGEDSIKTTLTPTSISNDASHPSSEIFAGDVALTEPFELTPSFAVSSRSLEFGPSSLLDPSAYEYFVEGEKRSTLDPVDAAHVYEWSGHDALDTSIVFDVEMLQSHRSVRSVSASIEASAMLSSLVAASSVVSSHSDVVVRLDEIADEPFFDFTPSLSEGSAVAYATLTKISRRSSTSAKNDAPKTRNDDVTVVSKSLSKSSATSTEDHLVRSTSTSSSSGLSRTAFSNRGDSHKKQNINEIITGLMHLLGSNIHVAHESVVSVTSAPAVALSPTVSRTHTPVRINDRGPTKESVPSVESNSVVFSTDSQVTTRVGVWKPDRSTSESTTLRDEMWTTSSSASTVVSSTSSTFVESSMKDVSETIVETTTEESRTTSAVSSTSRLNVSTDVTETLPTGPITEWVPVYLQPTGLRPTTTTTSVSRHGAVRPQPLEPNAVPVNPSTVSRPGVALAAQPPTRQRTPPVPVNKLRPYPPDEPNFRPVTTFAEDRPTASEGTDEERVPEPVLADSAWDVYDITLTATGLMGAASETSDASLRAPTGKPFVVPVDIDDVNIGSGADRGVASAPGVQNDQSVFIDGRRTYFHLHPTKVQAGGGSTQVLGAGGNVQEHATRAPGQRPQRPRPPSQGLPPPRQPPPRSDKIDRLRNTTPLIRIDTCIVGDESACNAEHHEVCRTEAGVSSCSCRAGFARTSDHLPCKSVVALLVYMRIDRYNNDRVTYVPPYSDSQSQQARALEREALLAMDSAFQMTTLAPLYSGVTFNKFYALGGKLALNITVFLQETPQTRSTAIKQRVNRDLVNHLRQHDQNLGQSRIFVDPQFSPVPGVQDLNECADSELNDCSANAVCENTFGGFKCSCLPGFTDKYPNDGDKNGRICTVCAPDYCNHRGDCVLKDGQQECQCKGSYIGSRCEIDGEVLGVALGASLAALLIIILTLVCLCMWSRRWKKDHQKSDMRPCPPAYNLGNKSSLGQSVSQPSGHPNTMDDRLRWGHVADPFGNYYTQTDPATRGTSIVSTSNPNTILQGGSKYQHGHLPHSQGLSRSRTSLMDVDDDAPFDESSRFHVPRPKSRIAHQQQNIYYDLDFGPHDNYAGSNAYAASGYGAYPLKNMRPYYS